MSYLSSLKKSSVLDFDSLQKTIEKQNAPVNRNTREDQDDRFWKPEQDKAGNAYAVIRFLPPAIVNGVPEDAVWVQMFDHGFQGPTGKWYIEKSLTTIGQPDPASEYNSYLWNLSEDDNSPGRKQARAQKRRVRFVSNILVVKDPKNPQNEGKVFLFKYGKKIFDKIQAVMFPKIPGAPKLNPFDPVAGADFSLFMERVQGFPNYDQSRFESPSPIGTEAEIDVICPQAHSLKDLISPDKFKTREELQQRLNEAMGFDTTSVIKSTASANKFSQPASTVEPVKIKTAEDHQVSDDDDDADLQEFKALAV